MGDESKYSERSFRPLNKLPRLQINKVCELYLSGKAAPLVLTRIGLRVVFELDVIQLAAHCLSGKSVIKHIEQHPFVALPVVAV